MDLKPWSSFKSFTKRICKLTAQKLGISMWGDCESTPELYQPQKSIKVTQMHPVYTWETPSDGFIRNRVLSLLLPYCKLWILPTRPWAPWYFDSVPLRLQPCSVATWPPPWWYVLWPLPLPASVSVPQPWVHSAHCVVTADGGFPCVYASFVFLLYQLCWDMSVMFKGCTFLINRRPKFKWRTKSQCLCKGPPGPFSHAVFPCLLMSSSEVLSF